MQSFLGVAYSRVRPTRVERTLEYMVTVVAMDSPKVAWSLGGSYTGHVLLVSIVFESYAAVQIPCHNSLAPHINDTYSSKWIGKHAIHAF